MTNKPPEKVIKSLAAISKSSKLMRLKLIYACALDHASFMLWLLSLALVACLASWLVCN